MASGMIQNDVEEEVDLSKPPSEKEIRSLCIKLTNPDALSEGIEKLKVWLERNRCNLSNARRFHLLLETAFKTSKTIIKNCLYIEKIKEVEAKYIKEISRIVVEMKEIGTIFNNENFDEMVDSFPEDEQKYLNKLKDEFLFASEIIGKQMCNKKNKKKKRSRKNQNKQKQNTSLPIPHDELPSTEEAFSSFSEPEMSPRERIKIFLEKEALDLQFDKKKATREYNRVAQEDRLTYLNKALTKAILKLHEYESLLTESSDGHENIMNEFDFDVEPDVNNENNLKVIDACLIASIACFLQKMQEATLSDIYNYLSRKQFLTTKRYVANLLNHYPAVFAQIEDDESGIIKYTNIDIDE